MGFQRTIPALAVLVAITAVALAANVSLDPLAADRRVTGSVAFNRQADVPNGQERHESVFAEVRGKFIVALGRGTKDTLIFDQATNSWEVAGPSPFDVSVHHCQAVGFRDRMLVIGCLMGNFPEERPLTDMFEYYPKTDTWVNIGAFPAARDRGSTALVVRRGKFYVINGSRFGHGRGAQQTVRWFDCFTRRTRTWAELPDSPRARDHGGAVYYRVTDEIFVGGGRWGGRPDFAARENAWTQMDVYSFASNRWSTITELFQKVHPGNTPARAGKFFILCGGEVESLTGDPALCEFFDMKDKTFKFKNVGLETRERHGTAFATCSTNQNVVCTATGAERAPRNTNIRHTECMVLNSRKSATCQPSASFWN